MRFLLALFLLTLARPAFAMQHVCGSDRVESLSYDWCIDFDESRGNPDVLYYLHGIGRTVQDWREGGDNVAIQTEWQKNKVSPPTVISISFGRAWLFNEYGTALQPSNLLAFVNVIMGRMETMIGGVRGQRLLKGESMGGFNASQLFLKIGRAFDRVALICPAIATVGPFATSAETDAFMAGRPHVDGKLIWAFQFWTFQEFPSREQWARHDPLELAPRLNRQFPSLLVSAGRRDEFGFYDGAEKFAQIARSRGVKVTWISRDEGHCAADPKAIADFLAPLKR